MGASPSPHHECLIYGGWPSHQLPAIAAVIRKKLSQGHRCIYFNRPTMIAELELHLSAGKVRVSHEIETGRLVLTSERPHLRTGAFDMDLMLQSLEDAFDGAMSAGCAGLWTSGDIGWEFGPEPDFSPLLEYELRLDAFFSAHPEYAGICQYHGPSLPKEVLQHGLYTHPSIFISEVLSLKNQMYLEQAVVGAPDGQIG